MLSQVARSLSLSFCRLPHQKRFKSQQTRHTTLRALKPPKTEKTIQEEISSITSATSNTTIGSTSKEMTVSIVTTTVMTATSRREGTTTGRQK